MIPESSSGTLTFLLTDVESSTRLLQRFPGTTPAALDRHQTFIRGAVDAHDGEVLELLGDGLYAIFSHPQQAAAAAIEAQLALRAADWGEVGELKVRMALSAGFARRQGRRYAGAAVRRCWSLLSVAHGGQTLLSAPTESSWFDWLRRYTLDWWPALRHGA